MVSQNIMLPIQEQLETFLNEERWEFQPKNLCVEEVLWTTACWITYKFPTFITPAFAQLVFEHLQPYFLEWKNAQAKVSTTLVMANCCRYLPDKFLLR